MNNKNGPRALDLISLDSKWWIPFLIDSAKIPNEAAKGGILNIMDSVWKKQQR